jgi:hypothetical protein
MIRGKPVFQVDKDIIDEYLKRGHKWVDIAGMLNTTPKTLREWRTRTNYDDPRIPFDNDVVDELIRTFVESQPKIGETTIIGHINGVHGIYGTREQFRASISR